MYHQYILFSQNKNNSNNNKKNKNNNNSIQFFIINVPSQQLQCQLQTQHNIDIGNSIKDRHKIKSEATK
jgi:hypothetical protein